MKTIIGTLLLFNLLIGYLHAQSVKNPASRISITIDDLDLNSNDTLKLTLD